MTGRLLLDSHELPDWMGPLARSLAGIRGADLSRLMPPAGVPVRESAVLVLFSGGTESGPDVVLIEKALGIRSHSGQVAFPGGAAEPDDQGPVAVALREAAEETNLDPDGVTPVAQLPRLWVPPSGYAVTPIVAWWHRPCPITPADADEVSAVHRVDVSELTDPVARVKVRHPSGYIGHGFEVRDLLVWGFTGGLLSRLLAAGGWERPWEPGRLVDIDVAGRLVEGQGRT
ncbi:MAG: CoA pyrophosphatase [Candidatus Nanopelagicales bacterium]|nr:CoA pyrophosphatase [Candidatus Nanopelagicales bacterium]